MNRRSWLKKLTIAASGGLLLPAGVVALSGCAGTKEDPGLLSVSGRIMGTSYSMLFAQPAEQLLNSDQYQATLASQIHSTLQDVDRSMSTWQAASEISLFNSSANTDWQKLSSPTLQVLTAAQANSVDSDGAFDVTVGPLTDLWGFGGGSGGGVGGVTDLTAPINTSVRQSLANVGFEALDLDPHASAVRKSSAEMQIDLSGIAKGYAVDRIAALMESLGIQDYLVEVGGELKASGSKPDQSPWRVAIERPSAAGQRDVFRVVEPGNRAIATSGDYRNFFIDNGQRYSHSIDPRTGFPVSHELASVTVLADTAMSADSLSTALIIMGPEQAMDFAHSKKLAIQMIVKSNGKLKEFFSPAIESMLV